MPGTIVASSRRRIQTSPAALDESLLCPCARRARRAATPCQQARRRPSDCWRAQHLSVCDSARIHSTAGWPRLLMRSLGVPRSPSQRRPQKSGSGFQTQRRRSLLRRLLRCVTHVPRPIFACEVAHFGAQIPLFACSRRFSLVSSRIFDPMATIARPPACPACSNSTMAPWRWKWASDGSSRWSRRLT